MWGSDFIISGSDDKILKYGLIKVKIQKLILKKIKKINVLLKKMKLIKNFWKL